QGSELLAAQVFSPEPNGAISTTRCTGDTEKVYYHVWATDYTNYLIFYTQQSQSHFTQTDTVCVYSRDKRPNRRLQARAYALAKRNGHEVRLWPNKQLDCQIGGCHDRPGGCAAPPPPTVKPVADNRYIDEQDDWPAEILPPKPSPTTRTTAPAVTTTEPLPPLDDLDWGEVDKELDDDWVDSSPAIGRARASHRYRKGRRTARPVPVTAPITTTTTTTTTPRPPPGPPTECKNMSASSMRNVDLHRIRGTWHAVLLNVANLRCVKMEDNLRAMADPTNADEYWYDIISESGIQGFGRLKSGPDGQLTSLGAKLAGERSISILDTDYDNYMAYYQCESRVVNGCKQITEEYGVVSRKTTIQPEYANRAEAQFNLADMYDLHPVEQTNCHYKNIKQRPALRDYHCKNIDKYVAKRININRLVGNWEFMYSLHTVSAEASMELKQKPNSKYSHVVSVKSDQGLNDIEVRQEGNTGKLFAPYASDDPTANDTELRLSVIDTDYKTYFVIYSCHEFDGSLSKDVRLDVYSRGCNQRSDLKLRLRNIKRTLNVTEKLRPVVRYNCINNNRYQTKVLTDNCIRFHNSEIKDVDFTQLCGRWEPHLLSDPSAQYDFKNVTAPNNQYMETTYHPSQLTCNSTHAMGSNLLETRCGNVLLNEAILDFNKDTHLLRYECYQYADHGIVRVNELLSLSLRPGIGASLRDKKRILTTIMSRVSELALAKVTKLVAKLNHNTNDHYKNFGQRILNNVTERVSKCRRDNRLSDKPDREMYNILNQMCRSFSDDELNYVDISALSRNWTLDYITDQQENAIFDKAAIRRRSETAFDAYVFNRETFLYKSNLYYDRNDKVFWAFAEGRRLRSVHLIVNKDYKVTYTCGEFNVNGTIKPLERLSLWTAENSDQPSDWFAFLELMTTRLRPDTWDKISDLMERLRPVLSGCYERSLTTNTLKTILDKYLSPKLRFEDRINHNKEICGASDTDVFDVLTKNCRSFDESELFQVDYARLAGTWRVDWTSYSTNIGLNSVDISSTSSGTIFTKFFNLNLNPNLKKRVSGLANFAAPGSKYLHKIFEGRRERLAILWTDYDNYMVAHHCMENEIAGDIVGNGALWLYSRNTTVKPRNLGAYIDRVADNLGPKTLGKIYQLLARLIPADESVIANEDLKSMIRRVTNRAIPGAVRREKLKFGEELYYKFMSKGVVTRRVDQILNGTAGPGAKSDAQVWAALTDTCHRFDDSELMDVAAAIKNYSKPGQVCRLSPDWITKWPRGVRYDTIETVLKSTDANGVVLDVKVIIGNEAVSTTTETHTHTPRLTRFKYPDGVRGISATLYGDANHTIWYECTETDANGVTGIRETLTFATVGAPNNGTELEVYLNLLERNLKPVTLTKVVDLVANIRPVDCDIMNRDCQRIRYLRKKSSEPKPVIIESTTRAAVTVINDISPPQPSAPNKTGCEKPNFTKNYLVEMFPNKDGGFDLKRSVNSVVVCTGTAKLFTDSNQWNAVLSGKRSVLSVLF
ncbi:unnamed protein product, partial [Medioppia subpectinata]